MASVVSRVPDTTGMMKCIIFQILTYNRNSKEKILSWLAVLGTLPTTPSRRERSRFGTCVVLSVMHGIVSKSMSVMRNKKKCKCLIWKKKDTRSTNWLQPSFEHRSYKLKKVWFLIQTLLFSISSILVVTLAQQNTRRLRFLFLLPAPSFW